MLHFAYGSNMSRPHMRARCPQARAIGVVTARDFRFVIGRDGFASIERKPGGRVHGVLWRLSLRDLAAINSYESVHAGLYIRRQIPIRVPRSPSLPGLTRQSIALMNNELPSIDPRVKPAHVELRMTIGGLAPAAPALVYIARRRGRGLPRPGYIAQVVEAARDWKLPHAYIRSLERWAPSRWRGVRARETAEAR
jgi:hypothetical protein